MTSINFYQELTPIKRLIEITNPDNFVSVPEDWYVAISDIKGSTQAIELGKYKEVNLLAACTIVAVLNIAKPIEIPFVFGGDGATMLIPPEILAQTKLALVGTKKTASQVFGLELRVGIIPIKVIQAKFPVLISKLEVSENYAQAIIRGGGISYAERLIKQEETAYLYQLTEQDNDGISDYTGLECRWEDIVSRHGEMLSLIVSANGDQPDLIYGEIIQQIEEICGDDEQISPVSPDRLQLAFSKEQLMSETKVFTGTLSWWRQFIFLWYLRIVNLLGLIFIKLRIKTKAVDWKTYKNILIATTDYKKFDDSLRMVIACTPQQRWSLITYLNLQYQLGKLYFGTHISDRALMTCLVFERNGKQVHFIDGANGGYTAAAKIMKASRNKA